MTNSFNPLIVVDNSKESLVHIKVGLDKEFLMDKQERLNSWADSGFMQPRGIQVNVGKWR